MHVCPFKAYEDQKRNTWSFKYSETIYQKQKPRKHVKFMPLIENFCIFSHKNLSELWIYILLPNQTLGSCSLPLTRFHKNVSENIASWFGKGLTITPLAQYPSLRYGDVSHHYASNKILGSGWLNIDPTQGDVWSVESDVRLVANLQTKLHSKRDQCWVSFEQCYTIRTQC